MSKATLKKHFLLKLKIRKDDFFFFFTQIESDPSSGHMMACVLLPTGWDANLIPHKNVKTSARTLDIHLIPSFCVSFFFLTVLNIDYIIYILISLKDIQATKFADKQTLL